MNLRLTDNILEEANRKGVEVVCICPGGRNAPFVDSFSRHDTFKTVYGFEERSAAFYALGRAKFLNKPVAVITTSGTAAGELLPAVMEASYSGQPLLLITADRPRRFRGSGAPQSCEQVGIFGSYVTHIQDLAGDEKCDLSDWKLNGPAHINVCFEEPLLEDHREARSDCGSFLSRDQGHVELELFLQMAKHPLVLVGSLLPKDRENVVSFLENLNAPVYLEGTSGIREEPRLNHLKIKSAQHIWSFSDVSCYPIDSILRIGGVPTLRAWRDLEDKPDRLAVFSLSHLPFSGLSWSNVYYADISSVLGFFKELKAFDAAPYQEWRWLDKVVNERLCELFLKFPHSEPALFHFLSKNIPKESLVYLGNSLPIREWDLAATYEPKGFRVNASRGLNGIDGQLSTFYGMCDPNSSNWGIFGDLTTLYDMSAPWYHQQEKLNANIVVVNNSGGQIFSRMFSHKEFLNEHSHNFKYFAEFWRLGYQCCNAFDAICFEHTSQLIECRPDPAESRRFWEEYASLKKCSSMLIQ